MIFPILFHWSLERIQSNHNLQCKYNVYLDMKHVYVQVFQILLRFRCVM